MLMKVLSRIDLDLSELLILEVVKLEGWIRRVKRKCVDVEDLILVLIEVACARYWRGGC